MWESTATITQTFNVLLCAFVTQTLPMSPDSAASRWGSSSLCLLGSGLGLLERDLFHEQTWSCIYTQVCLFVIYTFSKVALNP